MTWLGGFALLALGAGAGAALGALATPACSEDMPILCGPKFGAKVGASVGLLAAGLVGLGAAASPKLRAAGLTAAGGAAALATVAVVRGKT